MVFRDPYASLHPRHQIGRTIAEPLRIHGMPNAETRTRELLNLIGLDENFAFAIHMNYPAASASVSPSPGLCRFRRNCCCSMNLPRRSMFPFRPKS